jgi:hypothetical protein
MENTIHRNVEYILLPDFGNKITICKKHNIHFEILTNLVTENGQFITLNSYKISIPSPNKTAILKLFLDECEIAYNMRSNKNKQQTVFEYIDSYMNEDDSTIEMSFYEHPFISNKILGKNVFYDELPKLLDYIDQFTPEKCEQNRQKYAQMGTPFKASLLLYGNPGCGKSSTIKGILNKTGRHGVIVQWSKLKTCREFCSLFRNPIINGQKYNLSELCYIFEDFDANQNNIVKTRMGLKKQELPKMGDSGDPEIDMRKMLETIKENNKIEKIDVFKEFNE